MHWADEVWPYVNGKALMSGVNLREMEASDMLDVLHYLFEEDFTATTEVHSKSRSEIRKVIYSKMYGVDYSYALDDPALRRGNIDSALDDDDEFLDYDPLSDVQPFNPREKKEVIPYTPVTEFDPTSDKPFMDLDGPLG
ncbi:hypothetical protein QEH42_gp093 [Microbacterium phage Pumpernickel]|uniref:Uncharacterized protein n=1 Tax=Microbacterium phage Pumpernickel TaxID=2885983 RepID=A0AAE8YBG1_9CAUD|nr:hypothetical protein QEH42_gp093 [Microbacterium phage Pumpernickel]UDL15884.1 hypothetical protein SEA_PUMPERNICKEL_93 [Microbacterium phage Pumpernickel]